MEKSITKIVVAQLDATTYSFTLSEYNLYTAEFESCNWKSECSAEELHDILEETGFDTDQVFDHFEDYPCSSRTFFK